MHFIGRYYHALEQKGRLSLPKIFRKNLGTSGILTLGLDGCLFLYKQEDWEKLTTQVVDLPIHKKKYRDWLRLLANNAVEVSLDAVGRIRIPDYLQDLVHLQKEVVVVGSLQKIEIWDRDRYHTYMEELQANAESIAESLE